MRELIVPYVVVPAQPVGKSRVLFRGNLILVAVIIMIIARTVVEYISEILLYSEIIAGGIGGGDEDSLLAGVSVAGVDIRVGVGIRLIYDLGEISPRLYPEGRSRQPYKLPSFP
jgi:hypothetical protein